MKELYNQHHLSMNNAKTKQQNSSNNGLNLKRNGSYIENENNANRSNRQKELESLLKNPKSLISTDGLLDSITALVLDCEPMRKNKNIENFLNRC
jgi:hypothetical protein